MVLFYFDHFDTQPEHSKSELEFNEHVHYTLTFATLPLLTLV